jgi:hypothetical protein
MDLSCEYCQISEDLVNSSGKLPTEYLSCTKSTFLGTGVVALKRHCQDLSQVKDEEWIDFAR